MGGGDGGHSQGRLSLLPQVAGATAGAGRSVLPTKNQGRSSQGELSSRGESHLLKVEDTGGVHAGALVGRASGHTEVHPTLTASPQPQLLFQEDLEITHMYSAEGEEVQLSFSIYPSSNVEDWLREVENSMKASVRDIIERAIKAYPRVSHTTPPSAASQPAHPSIGSFLSAFLLHHKGWVPCLC